jgi:N-sulfoglucosamine sulfohydrolase
MSGGVVSSQESLQKPTFIPQKHTGSINVLSPQESLRKPNLILFMADDCSYYDIGCYGSVDSKTPNIDKFAEQGMRFTQAYQAAPISSPTRHNLLTGIWPVKTGAYPNNTCAAEGTLSIVHRLKPAGYRVALIGKSHVGPASVFPWDLEVPLTKSDDLDFAAVDSFIADCTNKKQPFCLFVMSSQPHRPWDKGDPSMFDPKKVTLPPFYVDIALTRHIFCRYLAAINYMDKEFGSLLRKLDKYKQTEKSVVVYLSEQGNDFPFAKWTCYNAGVHSACIVRWPGLIKPGITSDAIVEYVDIVPTFLEIAGANHTNELDGKSFVPVLSGKKNEHKQYTFSLQTTRGALQRNAYYGIRSVADKKYRYIINLTPEATFQSFVCERPLFKKWKEMAVSDTFANWITYRYQHRPAIELYDIEKDMYCMNNIAGNPENRAVIERMHKALMSWMELCGDKGQATEMEALEHLAKPQDIEE